MSSSDTGMSPSRNDSLSVIPMDTMGVLLCKRFTGILSVESFVVTCTHDTGRVLRSRDNG